MCPLKGRSVSYIAMVQQHCAHNKNILISKRFLRTSSIISTVKGSKYLSIVVFPIDLNVTTPTEFETDFCNELRKLQGLI